MISDSIFRIKIRTGVYCELLKILLEVYNFFRPDKSMVQDFASIVIASFSASTRVSGLPMSIYFA